MWFAILFVTFSICLTIFLKRWRKFVALVDRVPGPKAWPILGNVAHLGTFLKETPSVPRQAIMLERFMALNQLYGKDGVYRFWLGLQQYFAVTNYKSMENILSSNINIAKSRDYALVESWLGSGLLTSSGLKWKTRRKLLTPTFHFRILEDYLIVINEQSNIFTEILKSTSTKAETDIVPLITRYTLDIICETAMGVSINAQQNKESVYLSNLHKLTCLVVDRFTKVWLWQDFIYRLTETGREYYKSLNYMQDFTLKIIRDKKAVFEKIELHEDSSEDTNLKNVQKQKRRLAFLDILLNEHMTNPDFTEEHIREEVDTFMFEGHDTTAMGLTWSLYLIGLYPEVQKKLCEEIEYIFGDDVERHVTFDDMKEMNYLECVVKEVHRLYPPVPFIGRYVSEDTNINGYMIPKGSQIFVLFYIGHRDPEVFPQPEVFNPDNFLPENTSGRNAFAHVPFSAGPRNCIGQRFALMEEKVTLVNVLRNFAIESLDQRDKVVTSEELVLRPVGGIRMRIREKMKNSL